jgi:hypothetical protein
MVPNFQSLLRTSHAAFPFDVHHNKSHCFKDHLIIFPIYSLQHYSTNQNSATLILITTSQVFLSEGRAGPNNMTVFLSSPLNKESHHSSMTFLPIRYSILFRVYLSLSLSLSVFKDFSLLLLLLQRHSCALPFNEIE